MTLSATLCVNPTTTVLAHRIADAAARSDIETNCPSAPSHEPGERRRWYDVSHPSWCAEDTEMLREALAYLAARGLIERMTGSPQWVRFLKGAA